MKTQNTPPPRSAEYLVKKVCKLELCEEILGDLYEYYLRSVGKPMWKRRLYYWFHVFNFMRPFALKKLGGDHRLNQYGMFKNYFKTSTRNLLKNPLSSFINIFGLAVAIGACMVTYAFIDFDYSIDRFHVNKDRVFLTTFHVNRDGYEQEYGTTPEPLGAFLRKDFSIVEKVCRVKDAQVIMRHQDLVFYEQIRFVDPEFLEMFTFPLKWGVASSLKDQNSLILSEQIAIKYFGSENPVGETMKMTTSDGIEKVFTISGVAKAFPKAHIIDFMFLANFKNAKASKLEADQENWEKFINATLVQLNDVTNLHILRSGMEKYRQLQNESDSDWKINRFDFVSLHDLHLRSGEIRRDISSDGSEEGRVGLPFIAGFILILACFNYINIAVVSAAKRLKEIGLRKVIGANRRLVILQFLLENWTIMLFAGIVGFILAITIFLPWFSTYSSITSEFNLLDGNTWLFLSAILFFTGLVSGIYPAFYISKFEVVEIFKGNVKFGRKNTLTKIFLSAQLMLACAGIAFAVMFAQNSWYQAKRSWGYDQKNALYVKTPDRSAFDQLSLELKKDPSILSISGSKHHLSKSHRSSIVHAEGKPYEVREVSVDANYFETMGLQIEAGRPFKDGYQSDYRSIVVNEMLVKNLNISDPIGQQLKIDSLNYQIVGVVKDYHHYSFYYENTPTIFTVVPDEEVQYLSIRIIDKTKHMSYDKLQDTWSTLFPDIPFEGGFQEDSWSGFYDDLNMMQRFSRAIALVFVLISSLGLYGLVQLNVVGRIRELSIRKTLGAGKKSMASTIYKQYIFILGLAVIGGVPLSYYLNTAMISMMFADPSPFGYLGATISAIILVFIMVLVISTQVRKVVRLNPVDGLKVE